MESARSGRSLRAPRHQRRSIPGATRSLPSGSMNWRASSRTTACGSRGYCRGGMFPAADAAGRLAAIDDNKRAIDEAAALGAECLVLVVGGLPTGSRDIDAARQMVIDGLAAILPHATRLQGAACDRAAASDVCRRSRVREHARAGARPLRLARRRDAGVAIDTYHVWWDPALAAQIARAGATNRILAYHICDWLVPTRDLLTDRGMMGDGVINLPHIRTLVRECGLSRSHGSRDFLGRELVEAARRRGAAHLHRALQHRFVAGSGSA